MNRGLVASARKKLLRRGRALLRGGHGRPDTLGQMADACVYVGRNADALEAKPAKIQ